MSAIETRNNLVRSDLSYTADWCVEAFFSPDFPGIWVLDNEDDGCSWAILTRWLHEPSGEYVTLVHRRSVSHAEAYGVMAEVQKELPYNVYDWKQEYRLDTLMTRSRR